ncbi:ccch zinc finger and rrm domain-containing protein [Moniliophthora roreri MCA 2997]|uniref:Ccch zinc finger and rrm domain-containing protein n=1 Tax=Moniliophthora roreri (strain MCA 2997) TaxID=1381753 RepID=V2XGT7_MONRO|nr:ccch zinc finger and rrm domain-containing protein [Moniliophthora roreri MCA 2997]
MIFDQANIQHLKAWLVRTLEPICDAEPGALADYVLALLQHNIPESELRNDLTTQLDEFLEKECPPFIETLFTALRSKSYLPYTTSSPPSSSKSLDSGIPIPLDGLMAPPNSNRKRALEPEDTDSGRLPKGPRLSSEDQYSRYGHDGDSRSGVSWRGRGGSNGYPSQPGRQSGYNPPDQRRICRDYYNLGYCSRGALCKYSHGDDAMVPSQMYMNGPMMQGGMPFMPIFNGFGMGSGPVATYDPHEARMDMRQMGNNRQIRPAVLPRMQHDEGSRVVHSAHTSGELPVIQDLTPEVAYRDVTPNPQHHTSHSSQLPHSQQPVASSSEPMQTDIPPSPIQQANHSFAGVPPHSLSSYPQDVEMNGVSDSMPPRPTNNGFRGGGRGRGKPGSFRPERRTDKTLVLERIPEDKLSLTQVNDWFKRFGTVTNVAIDQTQSKALISFATHEEAHAAWKSEDAVFGNRFVKVFWHRPMEGQGQVGQRMLAASATFVTNANTAPDSKLPQPPQTTPRPSLIAAKQQRLEQLISEQKSQMDLLGKASAEEKKEIMGRLRTLDEEMKSISNSISAVNKTQSPSLTAAPKDKEQQERDRLDKELDLHSAVNGEDGKESTEELQAKLEKLKAEAASLGIPADPTVETNHSGGYRPYRGRARGFHRGGFRGGPPRTSMKLDNRPKKLVIKDAGIDGLQAIRDWYETTGQLEDVSETDNGNIIVSFKTRHAAEQGLAKGTGIPMLGSVQISWYTGPDTSTTDADAKSEIRPSSPRQSPPRSPPHEEEIVASGWGGNDEDGMGMI